MKNIIESIKHNEKVDHGLGGEVDLKYIIESNMGDLTSLMSKWLTAINGEQSDYQAGQLKQELNELIEKQAKDVLESYEEV